MELFRNILRASAVIAISAITKPDTSKNLRCVASYSVVLLEMYLRMGFIPKKENMKCLGSIVSVCNREEWWLNLFCSKVVQLQKYSYMKCQFDDS